MTPEDSDYEDEDDEDDEHVGDEKIVDETVVEVDEGDDPILSLHQHHWSIFTGFSWAHPVSNKTCWEKAHEFYILQGLFLAPKLKKR